MSGIFGVVSKGDCAETLLYSTDYHSHLGTEYGGLAVLGEDFTRQIHDVSQSQFKSKFYDDYRRMKGNKGIGVISASEEQPIYLNSKFGPFCIVTNGIIENTDELAAKLLKKGISFSEVSEKTVNSVELIAKLISQGNDLVDGIENRVFSGTITQFGQKAEFSPKYIVSEKERQSLLYRVKVGLSDDLEVFKLGMPVTIRIGNL